ncbi:MAG TPA: cytochrome c [Myxococcales bacterium]|nr:cytochrome c [Myxococcales bacterium]
MRMNRFLGPGAAALSALMLFIAAVVRPASAEADQKTVRTWKAKCASCHGVDGKAKTETGQKLEIPDFTAAAFQKKATDADLKKAITDGVKREGKSEGMDGYADKLAADQIEALVKYVRELGK